MKKDRYIRILNGYVHDYNNLIKDMQAETFLGGFPDIKQFRKLQKVTKEIIYWMNLIKKEEVE